MTTLGIMADEVDKVHQWATIVNREHRGHRLGLAIKAANLRAVQRPSRSVRPSTRPTASRTTTWSRSTRRWGSDRLSSSSSSSASSMPDTAVVTIDSLDPEDDEAFAAYAEIHRLAEEAGSDYPAAFQPVELRVLLRDQAGGERWDGLLGYDRSGKPVVAGLIVSVLTDNLEKAALDGMGRAGGPATRLRLRHGGGSGVTGRARAPYDTHRTCHLPGRQRREPSASRLCGPARLPAVQLRAASRPRPARSRSPGWRSSQSRPLSRHQDYRIVEYVDDEVPVDLLPSYLDLVNALMADAPTGDVDYEAGRDDAGAVLRRCRDDARGRANPATARSPSTGKAPPQHTASSVCRDTIRARCSSSARWFGASIAATGWGSRSRCATSRPCRRCTRTARSSTRGTPPATPT